MLAPTRRAVRLPFPRRLGRLLLFRGPGEAITPAEEVFMSRLVLAHMRDGRVIGEVDTGDGLVTTAGVNLLAADWTNATATLKLMNYHDSGTGATAAAIGDTALQTQAGPTTRATGTQSNPVSGQYRSVGTIAYTGALAITEWGLFSQAAQGGTMWDHKIFAALNVVNGDSIAFTYTLTCTAGG